MRVPDGKIKKKIYKLKNKKQINLKPAYFPAV